MTEDDFDREWNLIDCILEFDDFTANKSKIHLGRR